MRKFEQLSHEEVNMLRNTLTFTYMFATEYRPKIHHIIEELNEELEIRG